MTISVAVNVPEKAPYAAKVEYLQTADRSPAGILRAGESSTFYAHSGCSILVTEFVPSETASPETADTTTV